MIDEKRLREAIQTAIGYEPPSPAFGTQPVSRLIAAGRAQRTRSRQPRSTAMALVAALIALATVVSLVLAGQALRSRSSIPAHGEQTPWASPTALHTEVCQAQCEVAAQQALQPKSPAVRHCVDACATQNPLFATTSLVLITDSFTGPDGPAFLYRSDDAGQHWRPLLSWDGPGAEQIRSSADGSEVLVATAWGSHGTTLFHTADGGTHWTAHGLPIGALSESPIYFLNAHEGWVMTPDFDLVHTSDGGGRWTLVARLYGISQGGTLIFFTSSDGVYLNGDHVYRTRDGGATWGVQIPPRPNGRPASAYVTSSVIKFFNSQDGILEFDYCTTTGCPSPADYVYTTSDGGNHWNAPLRLPTAEGRNIFIFVDSTHWIAMSGGMFSAHSVLDTADAGKHWTVLVSPSSNSTTLDGSWDMIEHPDFIDPLHGWALSPITGSNSLLITSDGGRRWTTVGLPG